MAQKRNAVVSVLALAGICLFWILFTKPVYAEEQVALTPVSLPSSDVRLSGYLDASLPRAASSEKGTVRTQRRMAANTLSGLNRLVRELLYAQIVKIAEGESCETRFSVQLDSTEYEGKEWTAADLGLAGLVVKTEDGLAVDPLVHEAMKERIGYDSRRIMVSLANQCMSELYWFGLSYYLGDPYEVVYSEEKADYVVRFTGEVSAMLSVSADYGAKDAEGNQIPYTTDPSKITRVQAAIQNAKDIAAEAASLETDRARLKLFYDRIYTLSDYDYKAAAGAPYGDPWQIISVFDNDPETKVVCEGYSKAFQFLCDHADFTSPEISCLCATGCQTWSTAAALPASAHMWNVVHLEDGNYLVDLTNGGGREDLFLASSASGNLEKGFFIALTGQKVQYRYIYNEDTKSIFSAEDLILKGEENLTTYRVSADPSVSKAAADIVLKRCDPFLKSEHPVSLEDGFLYEGEDLSAQVKNNGKTPLLAEVTEPSGKALASAEIPQGKTETLLVSSVSSDLSIKITVKPGSDATEAAVETAPKTTPKSTPKGAVKVTLKKPVLTKVKPAKKTLVVQWKRQKDASGYELQYSLKKNFRSAKKILIKKNKTTSKKIRKLKSGKKYYVRIRSYRKVNGKKVCSAWSKVKKGKPR